VSNLLGTPISGATVSLSPGGLTTTTSANGAFTFQRVNAGSYTLTTSAALYTTNSQTVSVTAGQTSSVTVRMRTLLGL
jgi:Carboxypeptidase regulatory-like domain